MKSLSFRDKCLVPHEIERSTLYDEKRVEVFSCSLETEYLVITVISSLEIFQHDK